MRKLGRNLTKSQAERIAALARDKAACGKDVIIPPDKIADEDYTFRVPDKTFHEKAEGSFGRDRVTPSDDLDDGPKRPSNNPFDSLFDDIDTYDL